MELLKDERQLIQTSLIDLIVNSYKKLICYRIIRKEWILAYCVWKIIFYSQKGF